jgi:hypothetical protein
MVIPKLTLPAELAWNMATSGVTLEHPHRFGYLLGYNSQCLSVNSTEAGGFPHRLTVNH